MINTSQGERFLPSEFRSAIENGRTSLSLSETSVVDMEGEEIPVRFSGSILRDGERRIGAAAFFQDLREIKRLESEKLESERLAAVGQTVAQLAHGIKNILTGLRGGMYAIKSGMKSGSEERTTKGWEMLDRNVERITTLVKGFLSYSKKHVPVMELVDPREIAREIYSLYHAAAKRDGVTLLFEADEEIAETNMEAVGDSHLPGQPRLQRDRCLQDIEEGRRYGQPACERGRWHHRLRGGGHGLRNGCGDQGEGVHQLLHHQGARGYRTGSAGDEEDRARARWHGSRWSRNRARVPVFGSSFRATT